MQNFKRSIIIYKQNHYSLWNVAVVATHLLMVGITTSSRCIEDVEKSEVLMSSRESPEMGPLYTIERGKNFFQEVM
mgnify:CR=1 FL=1